MSRWKEFRYRLEERACQFLARGIPLLSRRACHALARALGTLAFHLDRRGRAVALANLECAFQDRYAPAERRRIARASYRNFARTMLFLFWARRLTPRNFHEHLQLEGLDALRERASREGRGILFLGAHHANWEWTCLASGFGGFPTMAVAEQFKNPRLDAYFTRARQVSGVQIIRQESSVLRMLKAVKRGGTAGLLIDLSLHPSQPSTIIESFGMKMCVSLLHAVLAQRATPLLIPIETLPQPDGSFRTRVHPPLEIPANATVSEIAQRCWDAFDPIVRARPEEYLWPYKHFRYKPADSAREYPFYANASGKFEKLWKSASGEKDGKRRTSNVERRTSK